MDLTWEIIRWVLLAVIIINELAAIFTVFREKRDIAATWAWLLVLTLIPVIGFIPEYRGILPQPAQPGGGLYRRPPAV